MALCYDFQMKSSVCLSLPGSPCIYLKELNFTGFAYVIDTV